MRMSSSSLGFSHYRQGLQTPVCCKTMAAIRQSVQWRGNVSGPGGVSSCSGGRNILLTDKRSDKNNYNGRNATGILLPLLCDSQERGRSPSHSGFTNPQQTPQKVQVQNAFTQNIASKYSSGRLVHLNRSPGRIFSHKYLSCA